MNIVKGNCFDLFNNKESVYQPKVKSYLTFKLISDCYLLKDSKRKRTLELNLWIILQGGQVPPQGPGQQDWHICGRHTGMCAQEEREKEES